MIASKIAEAEHVLIASHVDPDGDAVGSVLAMGIFLESRGKRTTMYLESEVPEFLRFLPSVDRIRHDLESVQDVDTAVIVDCGDISRVGKTADRLASIPVIVNIDHHLYNTNFGVVNLVDTSCCATTALLLELFKAMDAEIETDIALNLYTGLVTDTGSFRYGNTTSEAFLMAAELVGIGVDPAFVAKELYLNLPMNRLRLLKLALDSVERLNGGRIGLMVLTKDDFDGCAAGVADSEGFIDYVRAIPGVEMAVLMKEVDGGATTGVSLRTSGNVNAAAVAAGFSGGGHRNAAGFRVPGSIKANRDAILSQIAARMNGRDETGQS
ncbi:MAG: bifunctional oligoribonuclease/PAP phosphatase NrnA [Deltaproteobacteria bacterium]|nr:bifunctional oligoribonuclease/PAP phosphatase NrnA [Deltaproteobacteria bacterium]